ncbi:uncharacterized protein G2W53_011044 [Senna tora]|uniref:Uncharacterized protein n=1 Tax=Senna tora TaxID=362788 RepID=A0A834X207_9FABA|nr:uncharacterized protein G2W53_011044 [Senna tora]
MEMKVGNLPEDLAGEIDDRR